jgi:ABC-type Fe3+/spermidine/putrescine transport system ATPase subunit
MLADGTPVLVADKDDLRNGETIRSAIRPERIKLQAGDAPPLDNAIRGRIVRRIFAGIISTLFVDCGTTTMRVVIPNAGAEPLKDGAEVVLTWSRDSTIPVHADP